MRKYYFHVFVIVYVSQGRILISGILCVTPLLFAKKRYATLLSFRGDIWRVYNRFFYITHKFETSNVLKSVYYSIENYLCVVNNGQTW